MDHDNAAYAAGYRDGWRTRPPLFREIRHGIKAETDDNGAEYWSEAARREYLAGYAAGADQEAALPEHCC